MPSISARLLNSAASAPPSGLANRKFAKGADILDPVQPQTDRGAVQVGVRAKVEYGGMFVVMRELVLIATQELAFMEPALVERYRVVRAWENPGQDLLGEIRAIVCLGFKPLDPLLKSLPSLGLVACFTTGYDALDIDDLRRRGIVVSHTRGAVAESVAEFAIALILASCRNIVAGDALVRAGMWQIGAQKLGRTMSELRLGIVGMGGIGQALRQKAEALGMAVSWWGPHPKSDIGLPRSSSLLSLASQSDVLAVCARAHESNRGLISAAVIEALGPNGLLVNVARGQLVDEEALRRALREGRLGGAALDVFVEEPTSADLWNGVPNTILTPHIAGTTPGALAQMTSSVLDNIDRFYAGTPLATPIPMSADSCRRAAV